MTKHDIENTKSLLANFNAAEAHEYYHDAVALAHEVPALLAHIDALEAEDQRQLRRDEMVQRVHQGTVQARNWMYTIFYELFPGQNLGDGGEPIDLIMQELKRLRAIEAAAREVCVHITDERINAQGGKTFDVTLGHSLLNAIVALRDALKAVGK